MQGDRSGSWVIIYRHISTFTPQAIKKEEWSIILMAVVSRYWGSLWEECRHAIIDYHVILMWQWAHEMIWSDCPFLNFIYRINFEFCGRSLNWYLVFFSFPCQSQQFGKSLYIKNHLVSRRSCVCKDLLSCGLPLAEPLSPLETLSISTRTEALVGNWVTEPVICK